MTDELQRCAPCEFGLHDECVLPRQSGEVWVCCCGMRDWSNPFVEPARRGGRGADPKDPADMDDPRSTGRKRAAMIAPIFDGMECEWSGLRFAGGGVVPIIGCDGNLLTANTKDGDGGDLHHGPDKNTLNNTAGVNLHRICKSCHHTWHGLNDQFYSNERPPGDQQWLPAVDWVPHDPVTKASAEELAEVATKRSSTNRKKRDVPDLPNALDLL